MVKRDFVREFHQLNDPLNSQWMLYTHRGKIREFNYLELSHFELMREEFLV
jgi:hypothetical protein